MQARLLNKVLFFSFFYLGLSQFVHSQIDRKQIHLADSLFKSNRLLEAEQIYLRNLNPNFSEFENIQFKLAYIAKVKNDWLSELYRLSSLHAKQNTPIVANRLAEIGEKQHLEGYSISFIDQIEWIYFSFFPYLMGILLLMGLYALIILLRKFYRRRRIRKSQLAFVGAYILFLALFTNLPALLRFGIVTQEKAYIRDYASSAAPVKDILKKGNRINYWYTQDLWVTCIVNGKIGYIKSSDFISIN
jgi:hypothetical protein